MTLNQYIQKKRERYALKNPTEHNFKSVAELDEWLKSNNVNDHTIFKNVDIGSKLLNSLRKRNYKNSTIKFQGCQFDQHWFTCNFKSCKSVIFEQCVFRGGVSAQGFVCENIIFKSCDFKRVLLINHENVKNAKFEKLG